jgi:Kinesin motor domain
VKPLTAKKPKLAAMSGTESVQVMVRCRPLNGKERADSRKPIVTMDTKARAVFVQKSPADDAKQFTFDAVFDERSAQADVFSTVAQPIVDSAMSGYNGTIFAYGQTGTGKTHTMEGQRNDSAQQGIIPRAFAYIFDQIGSAGSTKYLVHASFLEIYNESIRDLLAKDAASHVPGQGLDVRETADGGVYVAGLKSEEIASVPAMMQLLEVCAHNLSQLQHSLCSTKI